MRKQTPLRFLLLAFISFVGLSSTHAAAPSGTQSTNEWSNYSYLNSSLSYYESTIYINTAADLAYVAYLVNNNIQSFAGKTVVLSKDIDLGAHWWPSIGNETYAFKGQFDGNNKTISNLYINKPSSYSQGLFGMINSSGTIIKDLTIKNGEVSGKGYVGGIVGEVSSTSAISNCISNCKVKAQNSVSGGIAGYTWRCTISNCINAGSISSENQDAGGIVGYASSSTILNSFNSGDVSAIIYAGGISGRSSSTITACINTGVVSSTSSTGSIVGELTSGAISNCFYDKQISPKGGINNADVETQAEGKLTQELTGSALESILGNTDWAYTSGFYPQLSVFTQGAIADQVTASSLFATPIFLNALENSTSLKTSFSIPKTDALGLAISSWTSSDVSFAVNSTLGTVAVNPITSKPVTAILSAVSGTFTKNFKLTNTNRLRPTWTKTQVWAGDVPAANELEFGYWDEALNTFVGSGDGSDSTKAITIYYPAQLAYIANQISTTANLYIGKYIKLMADIDLGGVQNTDGTWSATSKQWLPIGNQTNAFAGNFNGNFKSISNIYINAPTERMRGLFGKLSGSVKNVQIVSGSIIGYQQIGAVVGFCSSSSVSISTCANNATVQAINGYGGGIVGELYGALTNCVNSGSISSLDHTGGIAGSSFSSSSIANCINSGAIEGGRFTGGIIGYSSATISSSINVGTVVSSAEDVGAIVGYKSSASVSNCVYDKFMCEYTGIDALVDVLGSTSGITTADMLGTALSSTLGTSNWAYVDGYYPQLKAFAQNAEALPKTFAALSATPIQLGTNSGAWRINKNFTVPVVDAMGNAISSWVSSDASMVYNAGAVTVNSVDSAKNLFLTLTIGNISRNIAITNNAIAQPEWSKTQIWDGKTPSTADFGYWDNATKQFVGSGDGYSAANPITIYYPAQLAYLSAQVNLGIHYRNRYIKLMADLDLGGVQNADGSWNNTASKQWLAIGKYSSLFCGSFDGNNKTISNIYINKPTEDYQGLFGAVENYGTVKNIVLSKGSITGKSYVGGVVAYANCIIENCWNNITVSGLSNVGGIAGYTNRSITYSVNSASISASALSYPYAGGIAGLGYGSIGSCINTGSVTSPGYAGGIAGYSYATISSCISTGYINTPSYGGGIVGYKPGGTLSNNFYDKQICKNGGVGAYLVVGADVASQAVGKLTSEMTGTGLKTILGSTDWTYKTSYLPQLTLHAASSIASVKAFSALIATPISLASTQIASALTADFTLLAKDALSNNLVWASNDASISIAGTKASVLGIFQITNVKLTASVGGIAKEFYLVNKKPSTEKPVWADLTRPWAGESAINDGQFGVWQDGTGFVGSGSGSSDLDAILVYYPAQLAYIEKQVNSGKNNYAGKYIKLMANLDLGGVNTAGVWSGPNWTAIGNYLDGTENCTFQGIFDGNNKSISNLYLNITTNSNQGLFGIVSGAGAEIKNLTIASGSISGINNVGGIVGLLYPNTLGVSNCVNIASVNGGEYIGGIVGISSSLVKNCTNKGLVTAKNMVGGVVGRSADGSSILDCTNQGAITASYMSAGGITANTNSVLKNCVNTGSIQAKSGSAGIVCIVLNTATVSNCLNIGSVEATSSGAAGVVYTSGASLSNLINSGNVYAKSSVAGIIHDFSTNVSLTNSINTGIVRAVEYQYTYSGSIVSAYSGTLSNCFYDKQMSILKAVGTPHSFGKDEAGKGTPLLTTNMKGTALQALLGTTDWVYTSGFYPQLKAFASSTNEAQKSISALAAVPLTLDASDASWNLTKNFTVPTTDAAGKSIVWDNKHTGISLSSPSATVLGVEIATDGVLNMKVGEYSKDFLLTDKNPILTRPFWANENAVWNGEQAINANQFGQWVDGIGFSGSGTGATAATPILIYYPAQLAFLSHQINDGAFNSNGIYIKQMANLNLGGVNNNGAWTGPEWFPIGFYDDGKKDSTYAFQGHYDGNNMEINNLYVYDTKNDYAGLFGYMAGTNSELKNIVLNSGSVGSKNAYWYVGGIVGSSTGPISNCKNNASVSGYKHIGGIVGYARNTLNACTNSGAVISEDYAGGIAGYAHSSITNCENAGKINSSYAAGGIVAYSLSDISYCRNFGAVYSDLGVMADAFSFAGGIVGYACMPVSNCYNNAYVEVRNGIYSSFNAGGIVGCTMASISNCANNGYINGLECMDTSCGGIVGEISHNATGVSILNCLNSGKVVVNNLPSNYCGYAGGIVGVNYKSLIKNCMNTGSIGAAINPLAEDLRGVGGIAGFNGGSTTAIINSCLSTGSVNLLYEMNKFYSLPGAIVGYLLDGSASNCFYDNQMCSVIGSGLDLTQNKMDQIGKAEGKASSALFGTALQSKLGTTDWVYTAGYYPQLACFANSSLSFFNNNSSLASTPVYLATADSIWNLKKSFTLPLKDADGNTLTWTLTGGTGISLDAATGMVTIASNANTSDAALTATLSFLRSAKAEILRSAAMVSLSKDFKLHADFDPVSVIQTKAKPSLSIYPNPATSIINVQGLEAESTYSIYDVAGVLIDKGELDANSAKVNVAALKSGTYLLKVNNQALPFIKK